MVEFVFPGFEYLRPYFRDAGFEVGEFSVERYPNRELSAKVKSNVAGKQCLVVGTIAPPENNLLEFTLLAHTLRQAGASSIVAVLPYLAYARQDKAEAGESLGIVWAVNLLAASGVNEVVCIDIHSIMGKKLSPIPLVSISPAQVLASAVRELHNPRVTAIAPDEGAVARAKQYARSAHIKHFAHFKKIRVNGVKHLKLVGEVKAESAVIIDDILDTGKTVTSAAKHLSLAGVKEVDVAVAHGLFTGQDWQELWDWNVKKIYCLDTVPAVTAMQGHGIRVISCGPLLVKHLHKRKFKA